MESLTDVIESQKAKPVKSPKIETKRAILGTVCVCGKVHKAKNTYYIHRRQHKLSNDKTGSGDTNTISPTSPKRDNITRPASVEPVLHSNIIHEINMNKEFETMAEKFKGASVDAEKEKKYKYKCECGAYFNIPGEGNVCPDCGK